MSDTDPREAKLISIGHALWKRYKRNRVEPGLENALETVWQAKREIRAEIKIARAAESQKIRQRFQAKKIANRSEMVESHV